MPEKIQYNKKARKTKSSMRLLLKNGILYTLSITKNEKHKFKTIKPFKIKKWIIKNVLFDNYEIVDEEEIKRIIKNKADEQQSYDRVFALELEEIYELHLTNRQYEVFKRFLDVYEIELDQVFYLQRKGTGLKTRIEFTNPQFTVKSDD